MATEIVGIELQLRGADAVRADLEMLDSMINSLNGRKQVKLGMKEAQREIIATRGEIERLRDDINDLYAKKKADLFEDGDEEQLKSLIKQLDQAKSRMRDLQQASRELGNALKNAPATFMQNFKKISSGVAHVGSALQSAGNALTRFSMPFQTLMSGAVMGAGYKMLNKVSDGLTSGFTRWDTMKKYERLMKEYETANYTAQQSREDLDASVQGLPIALDDAISLAQRYTLSLGDMERGTQLAIATNNAFLASMATENQRYQGMLQMQDLLNGKELNSREWMSLGASMGKAINEIGKEFGYTNENMGEFREQLYAGKISTQEFLDALEKVGTGTGTLAKLAEESKNTWEAFSSRIGTAFSRMGYGIIETLDEVVNTMTGGKFSTLNSWLDDKVIGGIDKMTASVKDWIKANPQKITDFFKTLTTINWRGFIEGVAQGSLALAQLITSIGKLFGGNAMKTLGKVMVYSGIVGRGLTIIGGILKGTRHIWGALGAGAMAIGGGGLSGLMSTLLFGGATVAQGERAISTVASATPVMGKAMSGLTKVFIGWAEVATMVGGTALVGMGSIKALKTIIRDLGEIGDLIGEVDWGVVTPALWKFADAIGAFAVVGAVIAKSGAGLELLGGTAVAGALTVLASGAFWADMKLIKSGFKSIRDATKYINEAIENLNQIESVKGVGDVKYKVKNAITTFNQIIDLLEGERGERNNPVSGETRTGGIKSLSSQITSTTTGLSTAIGDIKKSIETLNQISGMSIDTVNLSRIFPRLKYSMKMIGEMLVDLPESLGAGGMGINARNMATITGSVKKAFDALVGENGVLSQIPKIIDQVSALVSGHGINLFKSKMEVLGDALGSAYTALAGMGSGAYFAKNLDGFREGFKSLKFALQHLQQIADIEVGTNVTDKIDSVLGQIETAFDVGRVNGIKASVDTFVQSIKDIFKTFEELNEPIEIDAKVELSDGFDSSVESVKKRIADAKSSIEKLKTKITFTIPVSVRFSVTTNASGAISIITSAIARVLSAANSGTTSQGYNGNTRASYESRFGRSGGGLIYRSRGGDVFKPRGTDTIPAMLTAGEYVHNKHAVNAFGLDFMNKVNNLDVRGAMEALLTKTGSATGIGRQSIINNTVNNNQRVSMNVNTNNPHFASMSLGRYAGAL